MPSLNKSLIPSILCCLFILAFVNDILAQKFSFKKKDFITLQNYGPIYDEHEIIGYYFHYEFKDLPFGEIEYLVEVLDENLTLLFENKFTESDDTFLTEVEYSGGQYFMKFNNTRDKEYKFIAFDNLGNLKYESITPYHTYTLDPFLSIHVKNKTMHQVRETGVLDYSLTSDKKYKISFLSATDEISTWEYSPPENTVQAAEFAGMKGDTIFSLTH